MDKFTSRLEKRTAAISSVCKTDPHVGYLLQRMCTGFAASVHLARSRGVLEAFQHIDAIVINAMDSYCPLGHDEAALARLPFRHGGLGLRATSDHAAAAFMAAAIETRPLLDAFKGSPAFTLPDDPLEAEMLAAVPAAAKLAVLAALKPRAPDDPDIPPVPANNGLSAPASAPPGTAASGSHNDEDSTSLPPLGISNTEVPAVAINAGQTSLSHPSTGRTKLQREFSRLIDDDAFRQLNLSENAKVRAKSCGSRGASLYLVGPVTYDSSLADFFMEPVVFTTAIRLRLGMVVREETKDRPLRCGLCHQHAVDPYGHSQLKCMKSFPRRAHGCARIGRRWWGGGALRGGEAAKVRGDRHQGGPLCPLRDGHLRRAQPDRSDDAQGHSTLCPASWHHQNGSGPHHPRAP